MAESPAAPRWWNERLERLLTALAVLVGTGLSVRAALNQPYNQNEWVQIEPYDSWDPAVVTSGTRQPPLDPILGALVQHGLGIGQFEQRVVPVVAGVGSLALMALLLRRLGLHIHGVVALWLMATAPLFLRYSAYARPYAVPLMLMLLCAYAGSRWLDDGQRRWLVVAVLSAALLPLARVPEPVTFLGSAALVLLLAGWRRWLDRRRAWVLGGGWVLALAVVGSVSTLALASAETARGSSLIDLDPGRALDRVPVGLAELWNFVLPAYGEWFPWWPLTVVVVLAALLLPASRHRLLRTWWWLPLVLAPLVFLVAYHTVNPFPLDARHYRMRFAYFWVPPLALVAATASEALSRHVRAWAGPLLVGLLVASQLPMTYRVLTENDTNDVAQASTVIQRLPANAVVLYDGPSPDGRWRQPFFGEARWLDAGRHAAIKRPRVLAAGRGTVRPEAGPVYLMVLDAPCVDSVACDSPDLPVGAVDGWEITEQFDRYTLYAPQSGQSGRAGAIEALEALARAYGPDAGALNLRAADHLREQ